jgi:transcriptional regulator with XRE-family HTH domain
MNIGERVRELRNERGVKATFIASKIGISQPHLSMIERDKQLPTIPQLISLSDFFGVSIDYLVKGANDENSSRAVA